MTIFIILVIFSLTVIISYRIGYNVCKKKFLVELDKLKEELYDEKTGDYY